MFRRQLIKEIGGFDTVNFPAGYGEEVDFSLRIYKAGFKQVIIPSAYVYHKKTASFSPVNKKELKKTSRNFLKKTYGQELLAKINADSLTPELDGSHHNMQASVVLSPLQQISYRTLSSPLPLP